MNEILTSPQFWAIILPAFVGIWTLKKTKEAERESEWRKEKLKYYLGFVEAISGITGTEKSDKGEINFAKSCNDLHALAPQSVLKTLHQYQEEIRVSNLSSSNQARQIALNSLLFEMRKDLNLKPRDKKEEFKMLLWTSGKRNE